MPDVTMCTLPSTQSGCLVVLVVTSVAMNLFLPLCCYERLLLCTVVAWCCLVVLVVTSVAMKLLPLYCYERLVLFTVAM